MYGVLKGTKWTKAFMSKKRDQCSGWQFCKYESWWGGDGEGIGLLMSKKWREAFRKRRGHSRRKWVGAERQVT